MAEVHRQIQNQLEEMVSLASEPRPWVQGADIGEQGSQVPAGEDWLCASAVYPFGTSTAMRVTAVTVVCQDDDLGSQPL